jgi:hypothetical protein
MLGHVEAPAEPAIKKAVDEFAIEPALPQAAAPTAKGLTFAVDANQSRVLLTIP